MLKVKDGDLRSLSLLFEKYNFQLYKFFCRMTNSREGSEDLVQNVFYRIMKYRKQFKGHGKFIVWMYSIARNELADYYRIKSRMDRNENYPEEILDSDSKNFLENTIDNENLDMLQNILDNLEEDKKQLIVLHEFQSIKFKEIGEIMGISEVNARVKFFRTLQEIKEKFKKLDNIPA